MRPTIRSAARKIPAGLAALLAGLALGLGACTANVNFEPLFGAAGGAPDPVAAETTAADEALAPACYDPLSAAAKAELARAGYKPSTWPALKAYLDQGGRLKLALPACE